MGKTNLEKIQTMGFNLGENLGKIPNFPTMT